MTLLFADGFEDGIAAWSLASSGLGAGRFGNGIVGTATGPTARVGIAPTAGPVIAGCAFKPTTAEAGCVMSFMDASANTGHVQLQREASGAITLWRRSTQFGGPSATGLIPTGAWSYVEAKVVIHDTTGSVTVRVNGVSVLTVTNQDTLDGLGAPSVGLIGFGNASGGATSAKNGWAWDDFYACDALGTVNNDFLGELVVEHLRPGSDDTAQWLGSDGNSTNNWDLIDEAGVAVTTDYVASSTVGQYDFYVPVAASRPVSSPVVGVMVVANAMKTDAGTRTVKLCVKEGAAGPIRKSTDLGLPTSFGELSAIFERKNDGTQFTVSDVNALRFGMEVTS